MLTESELNEQQKQALEAATKKVLDAITKEEAGFFKDHLDLMEKYRQDYDPPAWNWGASWHGPWHDETLPLKDSNKTGHTELSEFIRKQISF